LKIIDQVCLFAVLWAQTASVVAFNLLAAVQVEVTSIDSEPQSEPELEPESVDDNDN